MVFVLGEQDVLGQMGMPGMGGIGGLGRVGGSRRQQLQQHQEQQLQSLPAVQTAGTVEEAGPGYIKVLSNANQLWAFQVLPTAKCQLTGKAKAEALGPGCFVRFVAPVNKRRGSVDEPIAKLLVFTPSQFRRVGADPDLGFGTSFGERPGAEKTEKTEKKKAEPARPAPPPATPPAAVAEGGRGTGRKSGGGAGGKGGPAEMFDVRGQVTGISGGRVSLYVPNEYFRSKVRVELADNADIDVELDDPMAYTLARKGDKIRVLGRQGLGNQGFATDLDIILSEPLGAAPADAKKGHSKGAGRAKKGAEAEEPAAGEKKAEKKEEKKDADSAAKKDKPKNEEADADEAPKAKTKKADSRKPAKKPAKDADAQPAEEEKN